MTRFILCLVALSLSACLGQLESQPNDSTPDSAPVAFTPSEDAQTALTRINEALTDCQDVCVSRAVLLTVKQSLETTALTCEQSAVLGAILIKIDDPSVNLHVLQARSAIECNIIKNCGG